MWDAAGHPAGAPAFGEAATAISVRGAQTRLSLEDARIWGRRGTVRYDLFVGGHVGGASTVGTVGPRGAVTRFVAHTIVGEIAVVIADLSGLNRLFGTSERFRGPIDELSDGG